MWLAEPCITLQSNINANPAGPGNPRTARQSWSVPAVAWTGESGPVVRNMAR
jgi:hypothetical protein